MTFHALTAFCLSLFQSFPPLPPRAYQPKLVDPGLHGGRPKFLSDQDGNPGDLTPDGKVLVFYRKVWDPMVGPVVGTSHVGAFHSALQVAAFDPNHVQTENGNLHAFYTPEQTTLMVGNEFMWGSNYAITPVSDLLDSDPNDAFFLHYSPPTLPGTDPNCPNCPPLDPNYMTD